MAPSLPSALGARAASWLSPGDAAAERRALDDPLRVVVEIVELAAVPSGGPSSPKLVALVELLVGEPPRITWKTTEQLAAA